jgi:fructose-specific component phosphotransferase system IIB-like protein
MVGRRVLLLLLLAIAIPATAQTFSLTIGAVAPPACLALGNASYRIVSGARADYTVRIDPAAASPDIRIALSDTPDDADLVLVDDGEASPGCGSGTAAKNVSIDGEVASPDVTVGLATAPTAADYRIYVRSRDLEPMAAIALFAASKAAVRRLAREHSN